MTLTEFLQSLNEILNPVILKVNSSIPDYEHLSKLASDLKSASRELEEGEQSYTDMEKKLQEKLTELNLSLDEILNGMVIIISFINHRKFYLVRSHLK